MLECYLSICLFVCLERYHELEKRCREFENANNELKQLNTQLEKDLLSVGGVTELFRRGPEVTFFLFLLFFNLIRFFLFRDNQVIVVQMKLVL